MATWRQHLAAFFDPTVAVNDEGYLVEADGWFDSGSDSTDYLEESGLSDVRDFFYGDVGNPSTNIGDGFANSSDSVGAIDQEVVEDFNQRLYDAAEQQQTAAQSSADRAMEFSSEQAQINRDFNAEQAQLNRDFQAQMSNTAYQRAMADMQAAGLNPKLVGQLGGASTPSGSTASGTAASGVAANMSAANLSAVGQVISTYITGADALDRQNNDFVQNLLYAFLGIALK